jgi:hypothetical protein
MEKEFIKQMNKMWKMSNHFFPDKVNANDPELCPIPTTRVVFSDNRKILDIEDIAGNNIRIVEKTEAEWLIKVLERYINGL